MQIKHFISKILLIASLFNLLAANSENIAILCSEGSADACLQAAKTYSASTPPVKDPEIYRKHLADIAHFYKKACLLGNAEGCREYAMHYAADPQKDPAKSAADYFDQACQMGDFTACTLLKMMPS